MPTYTQCNKDAATHLYALLDYMRGARFKIVYKVGDGCLVSYTPCGTHHFVPNDSAVYYKEYVPPVVTYGAGRMGKVNVGVCVLDTFILGQSKDGSRKESENFVRRSGGYDTKWTHVITYHDGKPVTIEELQ